MTREITLDQIDFLSKLRAIEHPQLSTGGNEEQCVEGLHSLFISLLGAIAYATHTRVDVMVFIVALQRRNHNPEVQHVRKLNKLLKWVQRNPKRLTYRNLPSRDTHLRIISDAAFKKETEKGHCLRGALYLRVPGNTTESFVATQSNTTVHVLDWQCKNQRHVTRSTFAAELLSGGDAVDQGMLLSQLMHELASGPITATEARELRLTGGYKIPQILYVDAMSVFAAVTAVFIKTPAENLCYVMSNFFVNY